MKLKDSIFLMIGSVASIAGTFMDITHVQGSGFLKGIGVGFLIGLGINMYPVIINKFKNETSTK